jgi:polyferredoxin
MILASVAVYLIYSFGRWHGGTWAQPAAAWPWSLFGANPLDGGLWKTFIYSAVVAAFWLPAYRRWTSPKMGHLAAYHRMRHISILICQVGLFFLLPYFVLKNFDPANWWRIYGIFMPFPLVWEIFFEAPWAWTIAAALFTFVVLPIVVRFTGNGFCSWVCGCGCLAETLGDRWRHLAPKGPKAVRAERWIWATTAAAFLLAPLYIWYRAHAVGPVASEVYAWIHVHTPPPPEILRGAAEGSRSWYVYLVDFWYSGVVGVATYFFFGSRIWCRFGCPLRKYIEILAGWYSKVKITAADRCIACGKCDQDCEMGIPVMEFALARKPLDNKNSSCIQCGVCISVCPTYDLGFGELADWEAKFAARGFEDKRKEQAIRNGERNVAKVSAELADPQTGVHADWFKESPKAL